MKNIKLLAEIEMMKKMMGLITEDQEIDSQAADLSKVQNLSNLEGVNVDVKNYLDKTNPICEPPKTGNKEHDEIIKKIWEWGHDPSNKLNLKNTLKLLKDSYLKAKGEKTQEVNEQGGAVLIIAGITLTPSILLAIGVILILIIIICSIPKKSSCKKWKRIDDLV